MLLTLPGQTKGAAHVGPFPPYVAVYLAEVIAGRDTPLLMTRVNDFAKLERGWHQR